MRNIKNKVKNMAAAIKEVSWKEFGGKFEIDSKYNQKLLSIKN